MARDLLFAAFPAVAGDKVNRLALQISDDSPDKMNTVLGNATNAARYYSEKGEKLEVKVVAYSGGLNMLRTDKSPVLERLKSISKDVPNITFEACNNTIEGVAKKEGKNRHAVYDVSPPSAPQQGLLPELALRKRA